MDATTAYIALIATRLGAILEALDATVPTPINADGPADRATALNIWERIQIAILRAEEILVDGTGDRPAYETGVRHAVTHLRPASNAAELLYRSFMTTTPDRYAFTRTAQRLVSYLDFAASGLTNVRY